MIYRVHLVWVVIQIVWERKKGAQKLGKSLGKLLLGKSRRRWDLRGRSCGYVNWIEVTQHSVQW
jgi:hypothetical protein